MDYLPMISPDNGRGKLRGSYNYDHERIMIKAFEELLEPFYIAILL